MKLKAKKLRLVWYATM